MVEGQPLQYYPYSVKVKKINCPSLKLAKMEVPEESAMPPSPNSTHSDSDNSVASINESLPKSRILDQAINEIRCCWKFCGVLFDSLIELSTHVTSAHASSGPGGLFYCGWEGCSRNSKGFNARYKMLVHVRTHTNEKPHQCFQCEKSFSRAENLKIHSRSHSGEKPYVCPVAGCNKAYSNSSDRFKHTRTHQVEKPYQCKVPGCPKRYTDPSSLRKHVKTYKHFVNENINEANNSPIKISLSENFMKSSPCKVDHQPIENSDNRSNVICGNCSHICCCVPKFDKTSRDFLNLGAIINFREEKCHTWDNFFEPRNIYDYDVHQSDMDVDVPLDLSMNRKII